MWNYKTLVHGEEVELVLIIQPERLSSIFILNFNIILNSNKQIVWSGLEKFHDKRMISVGIMVRHMTETSVHGP